MRFFHSPRWTPALQDVDEFLNWVHPGRELKMLRAEARHDKALLSDQTMAVLLSVVHGAFLEPRGSQRRWRRTWWRWTRRLPRPDDHLIFRAWSLHLRAISQAKG